jgi:septal ring-binding cell division protein DamX
MAANAKDAIDRFLKLNINTENEFAYYKMYSNGSVWYKFISGRYKTLEKARTACYNLSDELKTFGPWPRHFASIHNDINKFIETNKTD